jgi:hypothetical protein
VTGFEVSVQVSEVERQPTHQNPALPDRWPTRKMAGNVWEFYNRTKPGG